MFFNSLMEMTSSAADIICIAQITFKLYTTHFKVNQSLESVRLLASCPASLLDPLALLAALEKLSDHAKETNHPQRKKFDAIFKQCHTLANSNSLPEGVLQLLGDKEGKDVASQIKRFLKVVLLSEVQLQDRPLIFEETIPTSRVEAPILEVHLVTEDVPHHSTIGTGPEPTIKVATTTSSCRLTVSPS